jgi:DNA polymerase III alpha subunit (gram-positive type)
MAKVEPQERLLHIYADIETDSFRGNKLLQISAISENDDSFNIFINPMEPLLLSTINFLGLHFYKGNLYRNGQKLQSFTIKEALIKFTNWIEQQQRPVILIFHNGFNFDCSILIRHLINFKIRIPLNLVKFGDTLPFFRNAIKPPVIPNHTLASLAEHFKIRQERAHCALSDTSTLKQICEAYAKNNGGDVSVIFENSTRDLQDYVNRQVFRIPIPKLKKSKKPVAE